MDRIGRYEVVIELGRGAMGVVYKARDPKIGRDVAIKTIRLAEQADPSETVALRDRLFREAQSAGRLSHPGIVTIYDIEEEDGLAYISMEFVEGRTLEAMMNAGETREPGFIVDVLQQTAAALDYAHSREIVHRDIKPANIMVTAEGRVKITDFGIARISSSKLTQTGTVVGTPTYMPPEQVRGDASIDGRADQFSLGVIAYELVTGRKPFHGDSLTAVIFKIVSEEPEPPSRLNPRVSADLEGAILKALAKDPNNRHPGCRAFVEAFATQGWTPAAAAVAGSGAEETVHSAKPRSLELGETAPAMRGLPSAAPGSQPQLPRPEAAPATKTLPPLAPRLRSREAERRQASPAAWRWAGAIGLPLAVLLGLWLFNNPWVLEDPVVFVRSLLGMEGPRVEDSVGLLLERSRSPLPPEAFTAEVERRLEQLSTAPEGSAPPTPPEAASGAPEPAAAAAASKVAEQVTPLEPPPAPQEAKPAPRPAPAKPKLVAVRLSTKPAGAQVVIDRRPQWSCTAPCALEIPPGNHVAMATMSGHQSYPQVFEVGRDPVELQLELKVVLGNLLISSDPPGADVSIDGRKVEGKTNMQHQLPPGYHLVQVRKQGAGIAEKSILVRANDLISSHFILRSDKPPRGRLVLTSKPAGANIVLNDLRGVGQTPQELELAPGEYRVTFSRLGHRPVIREINLAANQSVPVDVTLSPQN